VRKRDIRTARKEAEAQRFQWTAPLTLDSDTPEEPEPEDEQDRDELGQQLKGEQ
jgi:hypothetical protein